MVQLDLFRRTSDLDILKSELINLKETQDNIRRGMFARHNTLFSMLQNLEREIEELKSGR